MILHMEWILGEALIEQAQHVSHTPACQILYCDLCYPVDFYLHTLFLHFECYVRQVVSAFPTLCTERDNTAEDTHMSMPPAQH